MPRGAILVFLCLLAVQGLPAEASWLVAGTRVENRLLPFTTDGCSSFPDGIPLKDGKKWLHCCVRHDLDYWRGGTALQRLAADRALRRCVAETGEEALAEAMYLGVRAGGRENSPMSWRWGYGWLLDHGYRPLFAPEERQVQEKLSLLPPRIEDIPIQPTPAVLERPSLTGDYCVDASLEAILPSFEGVFVVAQLSEGAVEKEPGGFAKSVSILTEGCAEPFKFTFRLSRPDACTAAANEIVVRGRIRLVKTVSSASCRRIQ